MSALTTPSTGSLMDATANSRVQIGGLRFDWLIVLLSAFFVGGLYLDGWAHNHGRVDQSFFTPWHAVFYGGFVLTGLGLVAAVVINLRRGFGLAAAIPDGYRASLAGLLIFAAGGVGDLAWHTAFGIEEDVEALFSPTHLLLGIGMALIVSGPLRALWNRPGRSGNWRTLAPAILSASLLISIFTFFMLFAHPVTQVIAGRLHRHFNNDVGIVAGMSGMIIIAGLLIGTGLLLLLRWRLPFGTFTLLWGLNTVAMTIIDLEQPDQLWMGAAMLGGALLCDLLVLLLRPGPDAPGRMRLFAFCAPLLLFGSYYAALMLTEGTRWSIHLWGGSIFLTGIAGLMLSYLLIPPVIPDSESA